MQSTVSPSSICDLWGDHGGLCLFCGHFELIYVDLVLKLRLSRSGSHQNLRHPSSSLGDEFKPTYFEQLIPCYYNFVELSPRFELEVCPLEIKLIILLMIFILCSLIFFP